jgi:hypothetical protein
LLGQPTLSQKLGLGILNSLHDAAILIPTTAYGQIEVITLRVSLVTDSLGEADVVVILDSLGRSFLTVLETLNCPRGDSYSGTSTSTNEALTKSLLRINLKALLGGQGFTSLLSDALGTFGDELPTAPGKDGARLQKPSKTEGLKGTRGSSSSDSPGPIGLVRGITTVVLGPLSSDGANKLVSLKYRWGYKGTSSHASRTGRGAYSSTGTPCSHTLGKLRKLLNDGITKMLPAIVVPGSARLDELGASPTLSFWDARGETLDGISSGFATKHPGGLGRSLNDLGSTRPEGVSPPIQNTALLRLTREAIKVNEAVEVNLSHVLLHVIV